MRIIALSSEQLFLDGLLALLEPHAPVTASRAPRETVRSAGLDRDTIVVCDLRGVNERDLDYLIGAKEFGNFQLLFIGDPSSEVPQDVTTALTRNSRAEELIQAIFSLRSASNAGKESESRLERTHAKPQSNGGKKKGRPQVITNSLPLSARQYEMACLVSEGRSNGQIAEIMGLREQTVKNVIRTINQKLECTGRRELASKMASLR
jgi:DNA-binding NarL/FixJ family response regulator